jgi:hypothetical protein
MKQNGKGELSPKAKTLLGGNLTGLINLSTGRRGHYALYTLTE